jgi:hypothetical protein
MEAKSKIDYSALELARTKALQNQLKEQLRSKQEVGKIHSLRRSVLQFVVENQYDRGANVIEDFIDSKDYYPALKERATAQMNHAKDLIHAIKAKRSFPNLSSLPMSKQQEILDSALRHFDELKAALRAIEQMTNDEAVRDVRSTVWVIRTFSYVVVVVFAVAFLKDFLGAIGKPFWVVYVDVIDSIYRVVAKLLSFK